MRLEALPSPSRLGFTLCMDLYKSVTVDSRGDQRFLWSLRRWSGSRPKARFVQRSLPAIDGVPELSSEKPTVEPVAKEEPPPPPPDEPLPGSKQQGDTSYVVEDDAWAENYEEHIDAEETSPVKPRKRRRYGGTVVIIAVIIFLIIWTVLSPKVLPQSGDTYLRSDEYASLGGFAGDVDTWAGNATWSLSVSGPNSTAVDVEF